MKIIRNTYPVYSGGTHAEPGDKVCWKHYKTMELIRRSGEKTIFSTATVDKNGFLRSNGKQPVLTGVIAQIKSKGWILEVD